MDDPLAAAMVARCMAISRAKSDRPCTTRSRGIIPAAGRLATPVLIEFT